MKYEIRNTAKRPISILCNSGESRHLLPNGVAQFLEAEITNNPAVAKLEGRGLIRCTKVNEKKTASDGNKKSTKKAVKPATRGRSKTT